MVEQCTAFCCITPLKLIISDELLCSDEKWKIMKIFYLSGRGKAYFREKILTFYVNISISLNSL